MKTSLILDLDFTLLHLQYCERGIEVPGRTRSAYLAQATCGVLSTLAVRYDLIIATARSWDGTHWVVNGLQKRNTPIAGVVLEDGALFGAPERVLPLEPERDWGRLRSHLDAQRESTWPDWEWQLDFKACLVARAESPASAGVLHDFLAHETSTLDATLRTFRDGRKVYITGKHADKWTALQKLLGERAQKSIGAGDGVNDLCWLSKIATPCTFAGAASEVIELMQARGGIYSDKTGHEGIEEVLQRIQALGE